MVKVTLTRAEVEDLRRAVTDLADFSNMVTGFMVLYHTGDDHLHILFKSENKSELAGDMQIALQKVLAGEIKSGEPEES